MRFELGAKEFVVVSNEGKVDVRQGVDVLLCCGEQRDYELYV